MTDPSDSSRKEAEEIDMTKDTELEIAESEAVEKYIRELKWSDSATEHEKTLVGGNIRAFAASLRERRRLEREVIEAVRDLEDCPYSVDQASVPKSGIESAPDQVVGTLSILYTKYQRLINSMAALDAQGKEKGK